MNGDEAFVYFLILCMFVVLFTAALTSGTRNNHDRVICLRAVATKPMPNLSPIERVNFENREEKKCKDAYP